MDLLNSLYISIFGLSVVFYSTNCTYSIDRFAIATVEGSNWKKNEQKCQAD